LDLPLSVWRFEFIYWPAALYFILKNDAEFSFLELLFNVFSERIQARTLINSKENIKDFRSIVHPYSRFQRKRPHDKTSYKYKI